jgi:uncharacterized membrane protein YGL010W
MRRMDVFRPKHTLREYVAQYQREHTQFGTKVTHLIGIPMVLASIPAAVVNPPAAAGLALAGWALQYAGHYLFEGNRPPLANDPFYVLAGPAWVAGEWLQLFGLPIPEAIQPPRAVAHASVTNGEAVAAAS